MARWEGILDGRRREKLFVARNYWQEIICADA